MGIPFTPTPASVTLFTVALESFSTPTSVSSTPSYGGTVGSTKMLVPVSVNSIRTPQLADMPIGGHWVNGGIGTSGMACAPLGVGPSMTKTSINRPMLVRPNTTLFLILYFMVYSFRVHLRTGVKHYRSLPYLDSPRDPASLMHQFQLNAVLREWPCR